MSVWWVHERSHKVTFSIWTRLWVTLFGHKHVEHSGPYTMIAYYYKSIWYVTYLGKRKFGI